MTMDKKNLTILLSYFLPVKNRHYNIDHCFIRESPKEWLRSYVMMHTKHSSFICARASNVSIFLTATALLNARIDLDRWCRGSHSFVKKQLSWLRVYAKSMLIIFLHVIIMTQAHTRDCFKDNEN